MNWQSIITLIVLILCLAYAAYRLRKAFRRNDNPCSRCEGCPLKSSKPCHPCSKG